MRFLADGRGQIPQQVVMDAYPSWETAPMYRCQLTKDAAYYDDVDLYERDDNIEALANNVNYGMLHQAGRLF